MTFVPKRILLIEGNAAEAAVLTGWLEGAGHVVCGLAARADEVVRLAATTGADLAVMDVRLTDGGDGIATARRIEAEHGTPALFLTAHPQALLAEAVGLGWLARPTKARDFLEAVEAALAIAAGVVPLHPPAALHMHALAKPRGRDVPVPPAGTDALRAVLDTAPHGIALIDRAGRIESANLALGRRLGVEAEAMVGAPAERLACIDAVLAAAIEACFTGRQETIPPRERQIRRQDGRSVHFKVFGALVRDARGEPGRVVLHVVDVTDLREAEGRADAQAWYDPVTGLGTRSLLFNRLEHAVARAARWRAPLAVLLIDVDGFSKVQDAYGVAAGNTVLATVAARIDDRRRDVDTVARLGRDTFALLLEGGNRGGIRRVAEELIERISRPIVSDGFHVSVGACIGAAWTDTHAVTADGVLMAAADALYRAKCAGACSFEEVQI